MVFTTAQLQFFAGLIQKELGIVYSPDAYYQLDLRLVNIAKQLGLTQPAELWLLAQKPLAPATRQLLMEAATNNETSFFRDPGVFTAFSESILPEWVQRRPERPLRIWSAASSRGQEVYSIKITIEESLARWPQLAGAMIDASDVSAGMVKAAQTGIYSGLEVQRGLSPERLKKFFIAIPGGEGQWQAQSSLRQGINFFEHNLLDPCDRLGPYDVIFCRNVLIYQNLENKTRVLGALYQRLYPYGVLVLGGAESLIGIDNRFEMRRWERAVFYQRRPDGP